MDVISIARQLGHAIQENPEFIRLQIAKNANDNDENLQNQIGEFNLKRMSLSEEASKEEADSEKVSALNTELMELYSKIMENENMLAYNEAKNAVDGFLNHINAIITGSVNGENPDTIEPEQASCGGSCASCGGCH